MKLRPTFRYARVADIPLEQLKTSGVRLVLLDLDNTVAPWHSAEVPPSVAAWVENAKSDGLAVALLTNSRGKTADAVGQALAVPVFKDAKKPFRRTAKALLKHLDVSVESVCFVGDQLFTDIRLAGALGAQSVLVDPLSSREWWCTRLFNRTRERLIWRFVFPGEKKR
ncbi:MAG: YqeG family HAD IIIA-type phosphatase [Clostridia bacterium]|nr:YqeG family HAD IIIA-type phosphatase [Clostridia bacterium]